MRAASAFLCLALCGNASGTALCEVVSNVDAYQETVVTLDALAVAALHQFDVALLDENCPNRNLFLRTDAKFGKDEVFMSVLKQLYPGYPENEDHTAVRVPVTVVGKVVHVRNRGLQMTYLELQSVSLRN